MSRFAIMKKLPRQRTLTREVSTASSYENNDANHLKRDGSRQVVLSAPVVIQLLVEEILHKQRSQNDKPFVNLENKSKPHSHHLAFQSPPKSYLWGCVAFERNRSSRSLQSFLIKREHHHRLNVRQYPNSISKEIR